MTPAVPENIIGGPEIKNLSCDLDHAPFNGDLLFMTLCCDLTWRTQIQNLTTLASAVPDIWLDPTKFKWFT